MRMLARILWICALLSWAAAQNERPSSTASGCKTTFSDDLTNRVIKKSTLLFLTKLIESAKFVAKTNREECPELTFKGLNINLEPLEHLGRLVTRNGHVINDLLNSKNRSFLGGAKPWPVPPGNFINVSLSFAGPNPGCKSEANPFSAGNPVFGSLTHATLLSSRQLFAAGGCLGTPQAECFYRFRDYSQNTTVLAHASFPPGGSQWWDIPQTIVSKINQVRNNLTAAPVPVTRRRVNLDGRTVDRIEVSYTTSLWTDPYFDCSLGKIWMITYSAPILHVDDDGSITSVGITGVDINLSDIDVDECEVDDSTSAFNAFTGTHLCEPTTTVCRSVPGRGFNFGSYRCFCRPGFYRRDDQGRPLAASQQFFEGNVIDNSSSILRNTSSCSCNNTAACARDAVEIRATLERDYSCVRCPEGCDTCVTGNEVCTVSDNASLVTTLSIVNILVLLLVLAMVGCVFYYRETRVIRSASWPFLITTLLGTVLTIIGMGLDAYAGGLSSLKFSNTSCALQPWFHFIGFALTYGSILVKTWRLHQIFSTRRFRGKGRRSLSNTDLAIILSCIVLGFVILLIFWTAGLRPVVESVTTSSGLKYKRCTVSFINNIMEGLTIVFLLPCIYLSYQLRNITDDFSETREIHISVYIFVVVKIISLAAVHIFDFTPDLFYLINFVDIHLSFSLIIVIFFANKVKKLMAGEDDGKPASSFILNKKRRQAASEGTVCAVSLDDAHRRMSTISIEVGSTSTSPRDTAGSSSTGVSADGSLPLGEQVAYLPSVSEEKNPVSPSAN